MKHELRNQRKKNPGLEQTEVMRRAAAAWNDYKMGNDGAKTTRRTTTRRTASKTARTGSKRRTSKRTTSKRRTTKRTASKRSSKSRRH